MPQLPSLSSYTMFCTTMIHSDINHIQEKGTYYVSCNNKTYHGVEEYVDDVVRQIVHVCDIGEVTKDISFVEAFRICGILDYINAS